MGPIRCKKEAMITQPHGRVSLEFRPRKNGLREVMVTTHYRETGG